MKDFIKNLLSWLGGLEANYVLTSITSLGLFFLAFFKDKTFKKKDIYLMRIEKLYAPFYCNCISNELHNLVLFSELSPDTIHEIITHLNENIQYMGTFSQSLYPALYKSALELYNCKVNAEENIAKETVSKESNTAFYTLAKSLHREYRTLAKSVKLPCPPQLFK